MKVREYAAAYGVSMQTVYAMCAANKLPHVRLGTGRGTIRIPEDAVMPGERNGEGQPETPAAPTKTKRVKARFRRLPS
jgi:excisionase family DNA binding protein